VAIVFLGRTLSASAMARADDSTRAKEGTGQLRLGGGGGLGMTVRCRHR
jgi:hypothetical protein